MSRSPDRRTVAPGPGESGEEHQPHDLPAPYESPWGLLRRDLIAVLASLRLRVRELWRRNLEGDLSVPGLWPGRLAPLFWPLLLVLGLAIAVALPLALARAASPSRAIPEGAESLPVTSSPVSAPGRTASPTEPAAPTGSAGSPPAPSGPPAGTTAVPDSSASGAQSPQPVLQLDPLLALLADDDPEHLIRSAHPDPAQARLELELDQRFGTLPEERQLHMAQQWLERSEALGYEQLHLLDSQGRLLARRARVGSGMILFSVHPES